MSTGNWNDELRQWGAREYFARRGEYRNRLSFGCDDFNAYERGWMQSLKRDEGRLISAPQAPGPQPKPVPKSDYNAYAELKV